MFLTKWVMKRILVSMDQWLRWKCTINGTPYYIEFTMRDDGHGWVDLGELE